MKTFTSYCLTAVCLFSANALAADRPQLYDRGLDGATRVYAVACPDGSMASVTVRFDINELEIQPLNEEVRKARINPRPANHKIVEVCAVHASNKTDVCQASMDLKAAAAEACR